MEIISKRNPVKSAIYLGKKDKVIEYYLTNENNTLPKMSKLFNLSEWVLGKLISDYYNNKMANKIEVYEN